MPGTRLEGASSASFTLNTRPVPSLTQDETWDDMPQTVTDEPTPPIDPVYETQRTPEMEHIARVQPTSIGTSSIMDQFEQAVRRSGVGYSRGRVYFDDIKVDGPDGEIITYSFGNILNAGGLTDKRVVILGFVPSDEMAVIGAPNESGIIVEKKHVPYRELVLYKIVGNL